MLTDFQSDEVPCPLSPGKVGNTLYTSSNPIPEELALSLSRREFSRFCFHVQCVHSRYLSSYLYGVKQENTSCSACGHSPQGLFHLLHCPVSELLW